jgi:hypothetical protein
MKTAHVVHYIGATSKSRSVVASLVADLIEEGFTVTVIDISSASTINQDFPPAWLTHALGHHVYPQALETELARLGASFRQLESPSDLGRVKAEDENVLKQALRSELLTYFRNSSIPASREAIKLEKRLSQRMTAVYHALNKLWGKDLPDLVLIPNGRTSRQKAARVVAESHGIELQLYENGRATKNGYYRGTTQPHDRLASQAEVEAVTKDITKTRNKELAQTWLADRMSLETGTNEFSHSWTPTLSLEPEDGFKTAVFFSSSVDEFLAFGPMWNIDNWSNQFEAFDLMMTILGKHGYQLILRLHPNLVSKSRKYFHNEVKAILALQTKHNGLVIHWHNSPVNSYDLVRQADLVIVERSTIGLEASLMGKPVWATQASQWDQIADIRQVLSPEDITDEVMMPWKTSPVGAEKFVSYWVIQEHPLRYDWSSWSSWNPEQAPLKMKIALLAVKNSWGHRRRLMTIEWAKWRNRRFIPPPRAQQSQ